MAQKIQVILQDDLDGSEAVETVKFGLGGTQYEIDLSQENAQILRERFSPFVEKARKTSGQRRGRAPQRAAGSRERSADIRAWAKDQGLKVNERGRIPAEIVERYEAAH